MSDMGNAAQNPKPDLERSPRPAQARHPSPALENNFNTSAGPWECRAATFCDDGVPSFEVVMPDGPYMNACDARLIGAAPTLLKLLRETLDHFEGQSSIVSAAYLRGQLEAALLPKP